MGSVASRLGYAFRTPYAASKWGIVGLTQSLAIELGPQGVRVNAILPGAVEGDRVSSVPAARAAALGVGVDAMREQYRRKSSLRRMVSADDVAALALFLCSPAAAASAPRWPGRSTRSGRASMSATWIAPRSIA